MKGLIATLILVLLAVQAAATGFAQERVPGQPSRTAPADPFISNGGTNMLQNPSFEGDYSAYDPPYNHPDCPHGVCQTAQMADGWTPYWRSHPPDEPDKSIIRMPEYKPATRDVPGPVRVHSGERAQQYFTFYATHEAGLYQKVSVTPGVDYCFTIYGHSWSSIDDDPYTSDPGYPLQQRVGIDPTGGTDWLSANVVWGPFIEQYNEYALFAVNAVAQGNEITVFSYSKPIWPAKHNDVYWDDALLAPIEGSASMSVSPENLMYLAEVDQAQTSSQTIDITLDGNACVTWTASVEGGTLSPELNVNSGRSGEPLSVTVDSSGYSAGTYTGNVTITSSHAASGSPKTVPVTLKVVDQLQEQYLPFVTLPSMP